MKFLKLQFQKMIPLNWTDTKSYKDRLKTARKKTGMDCGMMVVLGQLKILKLLLLHLTLNF